MGRQNSKISEIKLEIKKASFLALQESQQGKMLLLLFDSVNYSHLIILCKRTVRCSAESNACIGTLTFLTSPGNRRSSWQCWHLSWNSIPPDMLGFLPFLQLLLSNVFLIHHFWKLILLQGFFFYSSPLLSRSRPISRRLSNWMPTC